MPFVEIVDPFDRLTPREQRLLSTAFARRERDGRDEFVLKPGTSIRAAAAAIPVVEKLRRMARLTLPEPPQPGDWRVWQHRQASWKFDALAARDSPVRPDLRGSSADSRKQLAMRAVKRVERFRDQAPAWWVRIFERLMAE